MSIILKGIDMPKSCKECPFTCEALQFFNGKDRPQSCPLVEIPTPHGRLIDGDDIYIGRWDIDSDLAEQIQNAPTILEAER